MEICLIIYYIEGDGKMFDIKKKVATFALGLAMVLGLTPGISVQAVNISTQPILSSQVLTAIANLDKTKKTIVIDPGHNYGGDVGAVSVIKGITYNEVDLNMRVASMLKLELEKRDYNVIMTRYDGEKLMMDPIQSLKDRVIVANTAKADLFISIHHNSTVNMPQVNGIETYYSSEEQGDDFKDGAASNKLEISKKMAKVINDGIAKNLNLNNRGLKDGKDISLFIRSTNMPSIVIENGFITNEEEAKRCADPISQQKVAETIADAVKANI
jgi:N-acetylmuramoyl-L-alanine amidase